MQAPPGSWVWICCSVFAGCQLVDPPPFEADAGAADSGAVDVSEPVLVGIGTGGRAAPDPDASDAGSECENGTKAGCATCSPGTTRCIDDVRQVCEVDGEGWSTQPSLACGACGGVLRCDGSCSKPTPPKLGIACGSCGGRVQCDGSCSVPTPEDFGMACGPCGGIVRCDGSCTVAYPEHYGDACGACGGAVQCDGSCSVATPANFGEACGACGGAIRCDGSCSRDAPANLGMACGSCGGVMQCDGMCSSGTPTNHGQACGTCGGTILCDGACSLNAPANFGQACGMCGGTIACSGACSVATPADYGAISMQHELASSGLIVGGSTGLNAGIDGLDPQVFGNCPRGRQRLGNPAVLSTSERGHCEVAWVSDDPHDCRVRVNFGAGLLDVNLSCEIEITQQRVCD